MRDGSRRRLDVRLYRACLHACPPSFRREYGEEMAADFVQVGEEAASGGRQALWRVRIGLALDLVRTAATQWVRTAWPAIGFVSIIVPLLLAEVLVGLARRAAFVVGPELPAETMGVVVLATVSVVLIAMTIALTVAGAPRVGQRRR